MAPIDLNGNVEKKSSGGILGRIANNPVLRVLDAPRSAVFTVGREFVLDPIFKHEAPNAKELLGYGKDPNNTVEYMLENPAIRNRLANAPLAAKIGVMGLGMGADILTDPLTYLGGAGITSKIDEAGNLSRGLFRAAEEGKYMGRVSTARSVVDAADKLGDLEKAGKAGSAILRQGKAGLRTAEELGLMPEGTRFSTALTVKVPFSHTELGIAGTEKIGDWLLTRRAALNEVATDFVRKFETSRNGALQVGRLKPDLRAIATSGASPLAAGEQFVQRFLESSVGSRIHAAQGEMVREIDSSIAKNFGATQPGDPFYRARRLSMQGDHSGALSAIVDDPHYAEFQDQVLGLMQRELVTTDRRVIPQRVPAADAARYIQDAQQRFLDTAGTLINGTPEAKAALKDKSGIATVDEAFRRAFRGLATPVAVYEAGHEYASSLARWPGMAMDLGKGAWDENFGKFVDASSELQRFSDEARAVNPKLTGYGLGQNAQKAVVDNLIKDHQATIKVLQQSVEADRAAELTRRYAPILDWAGRQNQEVTSQAEVLKLFKSGMSGAVADQVQRMEAPLVEKARRYFQQTGEMPTHMFDEVVQAKRDAVVASAWQPNDTYVWSGFKGDKPTRTFNSAEEMTKFLSTKGFRKFFREETEKQILQAIPDTSVARGLTKYSDWLAARNAAEVAGRKAPALRLSGELLDDLTNVIRKYGPAEAAGFMDPKHWEQVVKAWAEQPARDLYKALWEFENPSKVDMEALITRVSQMRSEGRSLPGWVPGYGSFDDAMAATDAEVQARRAQVTAARVGDLGSSLDTTGAFAGLPTLDEAFPKGPVLKGVPTLISRALTDEGFVPGVVQVARQSAKSVQDYVLSYPSLEAAVAHLGNVEDVAGKALTSLDQSMSALDRTIEKLGILASDAKDLTREDLPGAPQYLQSLFQQMGEAAGTEGPRAMLKGFGDFKQWVVGSSVEGSGLTRLRTRLQAYRDAVTARVKVYDDFRQAATQQIAAKNAETMAKLNEFRAGTVAALDQGFQDADQAVHVARDGFYEMVPHAKGATRLYQTQAGDYVMGGKAYGGLVPPEAVLGDRARYVDVAGDIGVYQSAPGRYVLPPEVSEGTRTIPVIQNPTKTVAELAEAAKSGAVSDVLDGNALRVGKKLDFLLGKTGTDEVAQDIANQAGAAWGDAQRYVDELFRSDDRVAQMKALQAVVDSQPQLVEQRLANVNRLVSIGIKGEELKAQIADMLLQGGAFAGMDPEKRIAKVGDIAGEWWKDVKTTIGRPDKFDPEALAAGHTLLANRGDADMAFLLASTAIEKAGFRAMGNGLFMTPGLENKLKPVFINEGELLKGLKKVTKVWRTMALLGPKFNNTNFVGGFKNNLAFGAGLEWHRDQAVLLREFTDLAHAENTVKLNEWLSKAKFVVNGKSYDGDAVRFMFQRLVGSGLKAQFADDLDAMAHSVLAQKWSGGARWLQGKYEQFAPMKRAVLAGTGAGNVGVEDNLRGALFLKLVTKDKMGLEAAWDQVRMVHFDYQDMSALDKSLRDNWVPFWAFRSRNVPLQAFMATYNPALTTSLWKAGARSFEAANRQGYLGDTPWWAQTGMAAVAPGATVISGYPDPFNDFAQQVNAASTLRAKPGQFFNSVAQSLGGPVQFAMELASNKDLLTGRAISPPGSTHPWMDYLSNAFGTFSGQALSPLTARTTSAGPSRSDPRWWLETFGAIPFNVRTYDTTG